MSDPITIEDIYNLFQRSQEEADRRFAEADRRAAEAKAEADRRAAEAKAEADRRFAEADRRAAEAKAEAKAEADRRAAEFDRQLAESKAAAERRRAEFDRQLAESKAENERASKELRQAMAGLTSRWGQFVENLVAPAVLRLFQERGIQVQETYQRVRSARGSRHLEIDVLAVDDDIAVIVEVKSRLTQNEVRQVLNILSQFKTAFPHYATYQLYGAVAAIEIDKDVDTYAFNQGLFVIGQSGDSVKISNDFNFIPRTW